jgi:tRNA(adenine34) deaminase
MVRCETKNPSDLRGFWGRIPQSFGGDARGGGPPLGSPLRATVRGSNPLGRAIVLSEEKQMAMTDEDFMRLALAEAAKAAAAGETPIGAVLVINGEVIAAAGNMREAWQDPTAHAETIVLRNASAKLGRWRLSDATLYVTLEPCLMCAGAMVLARIKRLVYGCRDPKAGALGSVYDVVRDGRLNHIYTITPGVLEPECRILLQQFFEKLRREVE